MTNENLYIRQTGIINPAKLTHKIAIVGAGSIGSWTALCLGKLGAQDITVLDFDEVEIHNCGSQLYKSIDQGMPKTEALQNRLNFFLEEPIKTEKIKWTPERDLKEFDVVIAAVDNITNRGELLTSLVPSNTLYIDARMAANAIEIYTTRCNNKEDVEKYTETLFEETDALPIDCSERSVVYNVFVVAGMIGDLLSKHANDQELPREVVIDLFNLTLYK